MKRILIVSDTHRVLTHLQEVLAKAGTPDLLIHLGDAEGQHELIKGLADCPMEFIRGNCDSDAALPAEKLLEIEGHRIFLTHGHRYQVNFGPETVMEAAAARGADIVMYGHTHVPMIRYGKQVTALNPGSLTLPRQTGFARTCLWMEIDNAGEAHYTIFQK